MQLHMFGMELSSSSIVLKINKKMLARLKKAFMMRDIQHEVEKGKYIERCIRKITGLRALMLRQRDCQLRI